MGQYFGKFSKYNSSSVYHLFIINLHATLSVA